MFHACFVGNVRIVELLLEAGNSVSESHEGVSVLFEACRQENEAVVELLLAHGADPFETDRWGYTTLTHVLQIGVPAILAMFRAHVAPPAIRSVAGCFPEPKVTSRDFLYYSICHPLSKWDVREYWDVNVCLRNGVLAWVKKYDQELAVDDVVYVTSDPLSEEVQRQLLHWTKEDAYEFY